MITRKIAGFVTMVVAVSTIISCSRYYQVSKYKSVLDKNAAEKLEALRAKGRTFVLRTPDSAYVMDRIQLSDDRKSISTFLTNSYPLHIHHAVTGKKGKRRYVKRRPEQASVLEEVHIYIPADNTITYGAYQFELDNIQKLEVLDKNNVATVLSYTLGAVAGLAIVGAIIAATKSSCPFVSGHNGKEYTLQGEIYSGAIFPQLERDDYLALDLQPDMSGVLKIQISNELQEIQYTNTATLMVFSHARESTVVPDVFGKGYEVRKPEVPVSARVEKGVDVCELLLNQNDSKFVQLADSSDVRNSAMELLFKKDKGVDNGRLLINIKNSYFVDLLYGEMAKGLGTYYPQYTALQKKRSREELTSWLTSQNIPLLIDVHENGVWKEAGVIYAVGPLANRLIAVPLKFERDQEMLRVRLRSGFMFWEIDYVAMDFTEQAELKVTELLPLTAKTEMGENVREALTNIDDAYLVQPEIGNRATLYYKYKAEEGKGHTYILHTRGHYEHKRPFDNAPDLKFLSRFNEPGAFPQFGKELYYKKFASLEAFSSIISNAH